MLTTTTMPEHCKRSVRAMVRRAKSDAAVVTNPAASTVARQLARRDRAGALANAQAIASEWSAQ